MAAHQNHIWKFGEKNNTWALVFWILESEWRSLQFYQQYFVWLVFHGSVLGNFDDYHPLHEYEFLGLKRLQSKAKQIEKKQSLSLC